MEILERKSEFIDRELERKLNNLAVLEVRKKKLSLRFTALPDNSSEDIRRKGY